MTRSTQNIPWRRRDPDRLERLVRYARQLVPIFLVDQVAHPFAHPLQPMGNYRADAAD